MGSNRPQAPELVLDFAAELLYHDEFHQLFRRVIITKDAANKSQINVDAVKAELKRLENVHSQLIEDREAARKDWEEGWAQRNLQPVPNALETSLFKRFQPLLEITSQARGRHLENFKDSRNRNREIIEKGNDSFHRARTLEDALLYASDLPESIRQKDVEAYFVYYQLRPDQLMMMKHNKRFIAIINMGATIRDWQRKFPKQSLDEWNVYLAQFWQLWRKLVDDCNEKTKEEIDTLSNYAYTTFQQAFERHFAAARAHNCSLELPRFPRPQYRTR